MSKWHGELRLIAIDKDRVVFLTDPSDPVTLSVGRRYAVAAVEIDDQEQLTPNEPERRTVKRAVRQPSNVAAILAKDIRFQRYAVEQLRIRGAVNLPPNEETATEYIRRTCEVSSRADLDINQMALSVFHEIELDFYRSVNE